MFSSGVIKTPGHAISNTARLRCAMAVYAVGGQGKSVPANSKALCNQNITIPY